MSTASTKPTAVIIAGQHGDEPESLALAQAVARAAEHARWGVEFHGMLNPYGFARGTRHGEHGDQNRMWSADGPSPEAGQPSLDAWEAILAAKASGGVVVDCHSMSGTPVVYHAGPASEAFARGCFGDVARLKHSPVQDSLLAACEAIGVPCVVVEVSKGESPGTIATAVARALDLWAAYGAEGKNKTAA